MAKRTDMVWTAAFFFILSAGLAANFFGAGREVIKEERRKAAAFPEISLPGILDRSVMDGIEDYMRDHTVFRGEMRRWKADTLKNVFGMKENNGFYQAGDGIYRIEYPLNEAKIVRAAKKFTGIAEKYFADANVYYSVIPDKNYFAARENGYPSMDYEKLYSVMHENMGDISCIEIRDELTAEDYYRTDLHWKQEEIIKTAEHILEEMGKGGGSDDVQDRGYTEYVKYDSYTGSYAAQSGWKTEPDTIVCLTNPVIESAVVTDYEKGTKIPVYSVEYLAEGTESMDEYDVYLSGAKALLRLENTKNSGADELVLFRDSFGSSIAPLFLDRYSAVTMIDLRYVTMEYADLVLELPKKCDVLFLYNTQVLNHSDSMR